MIKPADERASSPSQEDFAAWADNPVTRWVALAYANMAEANKQEWISRSWEGGTSAPEVLHGLRVRADAYRAFLDSTWLDFLKATDETKWREHIDRTARAALGGAQKEGRNGQLAPTTRAPGSAKSAPAGFAGRRADRRRGPRSDSTGY